MMQVSRARVLARAVSAAVVAAGVVAAAGVTGGLGGCSHNDPSADLTTGGDVARPVPALVLATGEYPRAFASSRDVLRDFGFTLERVDAQAGVITTQPKGTGGLVTPWDQEQTTFAQELEDAGQRHRRVARLEFVPMDGTGGVMTGAAVPDLRRFSGPVEVRAWVDVYRWHMTQWRLNSISIRDSWYTTDTDLEARGMTSYGVAHAQDPALAERLILAIRQAMGSEPALSQDAQQVQDAPPQTEHAPNQPQAPAPSPAPAHPAKPIGRPEPLPVLEAPPAQPATPATPATPAAPPTPPQPEPEWQTGTPVRKP